MISYPQAIQYLESFINYEKIVAWSYKESLKLERIRGFLASIGNPQSSLQCIHIAGTKGKGSTACFVAYILRQAGFKVGLYTSPHLSDFRERIRILVPCSMFQAAGHSLKARRPDFEGMIPRDGLAGLVKRLRPSIERYNKNSKYGSLSFFEVYTALAFVYFMENKVDFAVLETGLGGRLDATNAVYPLVCAITPISFDHTHKLGNTLKEIAAEKAGIIKIPNPCLSGRQAKSQIPACPAGRPNPIVICAPQKEEALGVIRNRCVEVGARLIEVGKDVLVTSYQSPVAGYGFKIKGIFGAYPDLKIRLLGRHQIINAAIAVAVAEALRFYNINLDIDSIRSGLYNTVWPGRCEVVSRRPLVILDGAQNAASSKILKAAIKDNFRYKKLILILGISTDKDIKGICAELGGLADQIVLTKANNPRATKPESVAEYFKDKQTHITRNVREAGLQATRLAEKEDLILVCGSLFVVGEYRTLFKGAG